MSTSPRIARATLVMSRHDHDTIAAVHGRSLGLPADASPDEVRAAVTAAVSALRARRTPAALSAAKTPKLTPEQVEIAKSYGITSEAGLAKYAADLSAQADRVAARKAAKAANDAAIKKVTPKKVTK